MAMVSRWAPAAVAASMVVTTAAALAAQAPTVALGKSTAKSKYTVGRVASLREMADGRVVLIDSRQGTFHLIDFAKGQVVPISQQGDGPTDFVRASNIFPGAGDSLLLYDAGGKKFLHLAPSGSVTGTSAAITLNY